MVRPWVKAGAVRADSRGKGCCGTIRRMTERSSIDGPAASATGTTFALLDAVSRAVAEEAARPDGAAMCQQVVDTVCEAYGMPTGWAYLFDRDTGEPRLAATRGLPPVFSEEPERWEGLCWCVEALLEPHAPGTRADNVDRIQCTRLYGVRPDDTAGLTHHTTVPLIAAGRRVGVMNVAREDWRAVSEPQLAVLTLIGRMLAVGVAGLEVQGAAVVEAVTEDRLRLAQELHDTVLQSLTGIALNLDVAASAIEDAPTVAAERLERSAELTQQALENARAAIEGLHARAAESGGLAAAIGRMADEFTATYGIPVERDLELTAEPLSPAVEHGLLRVVSEGLHNVVKHAEASQARITLRRRERRLSLILEDDGRGFERTSVYASPHGYGLASMRRRVRLLGGRFRLKTAPGEGTRVEVSVSVDAGD
jgi:two-component system, NarL family, sensor kinase